jgi:hypothetical protein
VRSLEVRRRRLAQHRRLDLRRVLEPRDESAGVERGAVLRLPPAVLVQAVQLGAALELVKRARKVHVAEDEVRLGRFVGPADEHRLGVLADELDAFELADDRVHRQREDAPAGELRGGRARRRLQLLVVELDAHSAKLLGQGSPRLGGAVRDEAKAMPVLT